MIIASPLKTPRLILRSLDPDGVDERYVRWLNDPLVNRYLEVRLAHQDMASVRAFVRAANDSESSLLLGIYLDPPGGLGPHIGNIKLGPIVWPHGRGDIDLVLGEASEWGKGYATEAIGAVTAYAHEVLGLFKVTAGLYADNGGSARAFLKAGFVQEARLKSHWVCGDGRGDQLLFAHFAAEP